MRKFWRSFGTALKAVLITLMIATILGTGLMVWFSVNVIQSDYDSSNPITMLIAQYLPSFQVSSKPLPTLPPETEPTEPETTEPETTEPPTTLPPEPEHVVARATIAATGDMLMHMPVIDTARKSDGSYNFDYIFRYLNEYSTAADWAVANLETTLCSNTNGYGYSGYPQFNCPDEIVDSMKYAGFDMLLTANNHSFDTGKTGYFRTIETIRGRGLETLGTMLDEFEPKYSVVDINGIKVGMMCYTYEGRPENAMANRIYLNGIAMHEGGDKVVNSFLPTNPEPMYAEVRQYMSEMKELGAEATVMFIHWGVEYTTTPVQHQYTIAQGLCDLGIDVIVGGHPHVVEPVALLSSTLDPDHKTVCLYSMGNAVSNQRAGVMKSQPSGHTEDGVWFSMTFSKYSDDTVYLEDVNLMPTWVELRTTNGRYYYILPLDGERMDEWKTLFEITNDVTVAAAKRSYDRTMAIVGSGLAESKQYLAEQKQIREAEYEADNQHLRNAA